MKAEIIKIADDLRNGAIDTETAQTLLLGLFSVSHSALLKELLGKCKEVYGMSGLRISCLTEHEIKQTFEEYGIKYEPPF